MTEFIYKNGEDNATNFFISKQLEKYKVKTILELYKTLSKEIINTSSFIKSDDEKRFILLSTFKLVFNEYNRLESYKCINYSNIISKEEFKNTMIKINNIDSIKIRCKEADNLMIKTLSSLGYDEGINIYKNREGI